MRRYVTRKSVASAIVFLLMLLGGVWVTRTPQKLAPTPAEPLKSEPIGVAPEMAPEISRRPEPEQLFEIFSDQTISYNGYEMKSFTETVRDETDGEIEVSYAALMKGERRMLTFDGVYFIQGNMTEFGLFGLLGNGSQQFIVSQTVPRGGRHWVDYALHGIEQDIASLDSGEANYLSRRLNILLRYVYARKAKEGWAFFDRAYRRPDKHQIAARIRSVLKRAPVYR